MDPTIIRESKHLRLVGGSTKHWRHDSVDLVRWDWSWSHETDNGQGNIINMMVVKSNMVFCGLWFVVCALGQLMPH